jgi:hypothetical protein
MSSHATGWPHRWSFPEVVPESQPEEQGTADVGLETALLERTRHTARSTCERRTRPHCVPGPPGPGLEVARGAGRPPARPAGLRAKEPLRAPHSRAAKRGSFDGNRRLVVLPRPIASNQKGAELRRWRVAREKSIRKFHGRRFRLHSRAVPSADCTICSAPF